MSFGIPHPLRKYRFELLVGLVAAGSILALRMLGLFQLLELRTFDWMLRLRPAEPMDERLVILRVSEEDLNWLGTPVLTDQNMADLINRVKLQNPRVIGLDFYRNLPVEPGHKALQAVLKSTPNLIGIKKVVQSSELEALPGNPMLADSGQLAASDVVVDVDGRVRRGLLFPSASGSTVLEGLGLRVALDYLAQEKITPELESPILRLGGVDFFPLESYTGGYTNVDAGGYQMLLNLRQADVPGQIISLKAVMTGQIPPDLMRDRIVMIGSAAISNSDLFYTSRSSSSREADQYTFGVEIHAGIASQIISAVLDGRPLLRALPEWAEGLMVVVVAYVGVGLQTLAISEWWRAALTVGCGIVAIGFGVGVLILGGWWLPILPTVFALSLSSMMMGFYRTNQLKTLSARDKLTGLANRRTFDETLQREWFRALRSQSTLSLIICDVDYFKRYNDTYGHLQGDECLRNVARAIRSAVKRSADLAARYGGEEFVVLLPNTTTEGAVALAEAIRYQVRALKIPHSASDVADHVTLSLGVTSLVPTMIMPTNALIEIADLGLYTAKQSGRDRVVVHLPETFSQPLQNETNAAVADTAGKPPNPPARSAR